MAEKITELEKSIQSHEKRILALEKILNRQQLKIPHKKAKDETSFKGLMGGIRFLMSKGFLNEPKASKEVEEGLKKEGYHYSYKSVDKILRVNLTQKQKILTRVREDNIWKYVIRK
jgi:ribonucleotide reductase alpha subunit